MVVTGCSVVSCTVLSHFHFPRWLSSRPRHISLTINKDVSPESESVSKWRSSSLIFILIPIMIMTTASVPQVSSVTVIVEIVTPWPVHSTVLTIPILRFDIFHSAHSPAHNIPFLRHFNFSENGIWKRNHKAALASGHNWCKAVFACSYIHGGNEITTK